MNALGNGWRPSSQSEPPFVHTDDGRLHKTYANCPQATAVGVGVYNFYGPEQAALLLNSKDAYGCGCLIGVLPEKKS